MQIFCFRDVWFNADRIDRIKATKNNSLIVIQSKTHEEFHCVGEQSIKELEHEFLTAIYREENHKILEGYRRGDALITNEDQNLSAPETFTTLTLDKVKRSKTLKTSEDVKEV